MKRAIFNIVCLSLILCGCATIIRGTKQDIAMATTPAGAKIIIQGVERGKTPTIIELPRNQEVIVRFEKEGYEPVSVKLTKEMDAGCLLGNCIFGGIIGIAIDFGSGAIYSLSPYEINIVLDEMKNQGMNIEDYKDKMVVIAIDMKEIEK